MKKFPSDAEALQALDDTEQELSVRESAASYLGQHLLPHNLNRLVAALEDGEFGVRWTAAVALTKAGDAALQPLLHALSQHSSVWLRENAHHVLYYSESATVTEKTSELLNAMRGPAADVATMSMARKLLSTITN